MSSCCVTAACSGSINYTRRHCTVNTFFFHLGPLKIVFLTFKILKPKYIVKCRRALIIRLNLPQPPLWKIACQPVMERKMYIINIQKCSNEIQNKGNEQRLSTESLYFKLYFFKTDICEVYTAYITLLRLFGDYIRQMNNKIF